MTQNLKNFALYSALILFFFALVFWVYTFMPVDVTWPTPGIGVDWKEAFRPAALKLLHGESPYIPLFYNPPWVLIPLIPVALLSPELGSAVMYALNMVAYLYVAYRLKTNPILMVLFVFYSGMLLVSANGNIEGLLALGFLLPPQIGLFFVLAKPQFGIAVAVFWGIQALQEGGIKQAIKTFWPVTIAYIISFILFGFWILPSDTLLSAWWNTSLFPQSIPVGIGLLALSVWKKEIRYAIAASPFFAPYLTGHTWAVVWLGSLSLFEMRKNDILVMSGKAIKQRQ